jgi:hypothetical protein
MHDPLLLDRTANKYGTHPVAVRFGYALLVGTVGYECT